MSLFVCFYCYIRQEKDRLLSEAVKSFDCALAMDRNQQTAKDHLEKIQLQINLKTEVGGDCYFIFTLFLQSLFLGTPKSCPEEYLKEKAKKHLDLIKQRDTQQPNEPIIAQFKYLQPKRGKRLASVTLALHF